MSYLRIIQLELWGCNFFFGTNKKKYLSHLSHRKKENSWFNWFDDFMDLSDIRILYIDIISNFLEPYEEKTSYTFLGRYCSFTSIPMSYLSNRCNWCSIPKRRKRSSESGFLWSDKESNRFKCSCYSIFPWKRRSAYRNCSWYFKEGRGFYWTWS